MNFFKKSGFALAAIVAALYGTLSATPAAAGQCLSSSVEDLTAKVEDAWNRYYPHVIGGASAKVFPDESAEGSAARYEELNGLLTALRELDLARVEDRIIRERYVQLVQERTRAYELKAETWWGMRYRGDGLGTPINTFVDTVKATEAGAGDDALLGYYRALPVYIDQWIAKMDTETPDYFFGVEKLDTDYYVKTTTEWAADREFYAAPFGTAHAEEVEAVVAAFDRLKDAYDPATSGRKILRSYEKPSIKHLPRGDDLYKWHMMKHLATDAPQYAADVLFEEGKTMTDDLNARCLKAYGKVVGKPDANNLQEMNDWILNSPENNPYTNVSEVLDEYNRVGMKLATLLVKEFGNFPICPYTIATCFDLGPPESCRGGVAFYNRGVFRDGVCEKAGTYVLDFAPNGDTKDFPKSMTTTLLMHEAIPGHHQQVMLGQEADPACVPEFIMRAGKLTVMVEGWALYSETTGFNIGAYEDPQQEIGHYQDRLLRSARLVVDTGLHYYDWGMEECVQYLLENSGFSEQGIRAQCDRYAIYPGQALSYMVGSLAYEDARAKAEAALGENFDPRPFHKHMLQYGDMAVEQIAELSQSFIDQQTKKDTAAPAESNADAVTSEPPAPAAESESEGDSGFSAGVLAGGVVGGIALGAIIGGIASFFVSKRKYGKGAAAESQLDLGAKA